MPRPPFLAALVVALVAAGCGGPDGRTEAPAPPPQSPTWRLTKATGLPHAIAAIVEVPAAARFELVALEEGEDPHVLAERTVHAGAVLPLEWAIRAVEPERSATRVPPQDAEAAGRTEPHPVRVDGAFEHESYDTWVPVVWTRPGLGGGEVRTASPPREGEALPASGDVELGAVAVFDAPRDRRQVGRVGGRLTAHVEDAGPGDHVEVVRIVLRISSPPR